MGITRGVAQSAGSGRKNQKTINILLAENIIFFLSGLRDHTPESPDLRPSSQRPEVDFNWSPVYLGERSVRFEAKLGSNRVDVKPG